MAKINEVVDVEETGLVLQSKPVVADVPMEVGKTGLDSLYDHYQKKLYVFDCSGSMADGMLPEDEAQMYIWDAGTLEKFRDLIRDEAKLVDPAIDPFDENGDDYIGFSATDDKALIAYVIKQGLHRRPGMEPMQDYNHLRRSERKIEAVRGAMKKFIERRFKQYPDAQVGMIAFGGRAEIRAYPGAPKPELMLAVDALGSDMGGTNISEAIKRALNEFKRAPSHVGSHHIVMVTDAEAYMEPEEAKAFLHQMKEMNVMFDFIYVKGCNQGDNDWRGFGNPEDSILNILKRMCRETGGEYQEVSKSSDFEEKFFAASERKALPPYQGGK